MVSMVDTEVSTRNTPPQCIHVQRNKAQTHPYTHRQMFD